MISKTQYESTEEMNECRKKAIIGMKKLYKKWGFVIFEITREDVR